MDDLINGKFRQYRRQSRVAKFQYVPAGMLLGMREFDVNRVLILPIMYLL